MSDSQPRRPDDHAADTTGGPETSALTLCGARLADGRVVDVRVCGARIEAVGTAGSLTAAPGARLDLRG
ncbi:hydrolase, partial [Streptomyces sp. SID7909]|nr:hydrolase [Streptomyces sp. SID7909]